VILIALILWEGLYGIPHSIRTEAANWPAPTIRPYLSFAVIPGIEARPVLGSSPVSSRSPLLIKLDIYNDGFARITNEGVNSVRDIEVDISEQEMDMAYPPRGHEEDAVPKVKASSFWSSPFELLHEELKSEKTSRFDLKKIIDFNTLPETNAAARAMSPEKENEIERTFFVFRFTFRDNRTGEKYGCFKIHASYLKYPSAVDDNVGLYATPAYSRFITQLEETAIAVAKNHYKDGAMVFQCEN
jgi:hypothetical protein